MSKALFADGGIALTIASIARLELNAPGRCNAVSGIMWKGLIQACERIEEVSEIRVIILSGIGKHFCAGADISEFGQVYATRESSTAYNSLVRTAEARVRHLPQPVIAEIRGAALGAGCGLAMAADLRFASTTARLGITASRLGLVYSPEDTAQLIEKIGPIRAKDMLMSARIIEATEALSWGLIDRAIPEGDLEQAVLKYAAELAERSRTSLDATKRIVNGLTAPVPSLCDMLRPFYVEAFQGPDAVEGRASFLEKRAPKFR
jgi:enoyl-CoA hydratase